MMQTIVDYGLVCSIGSGRQEVADRLFSSKRTGLKPHVLSNGKKTFTGAIQSPLADFPENFDALKTRNNRLLYTIFKQIEPSFSRLSEGLNKSRIGIVIGTSTSGISDVEEAFVYKQKNGTFPVDYHYKKHEMGSPSEFLQKVTGSHGPAYTVSCACSSGSKALASASRLLSSGICDLVVTGGVDTLCDLTLLGFDSLEVISENPCLPFSKNRRGINIGEGGALFLMTNEKGRLNLIGFGESSDAHHHSAPEPHGKGAVQSMQSALNTAGLSRQDIDYINLHGTGTLQNDSMEAIAVNELFDSAVPCSSTKSLTGHTLGAAGALEAAFSLLSIENNLTPVHHWDSAQDKEIPQLNLLDNSSSVKEVRTVMSNSYAFGGNNCTLILGGNI